MRTFWLVCTFFLFSCVAGAGVRAETILAVQCTPDTELTPQWLVELRRTSSHRVLDRGDLMTLRSLEGENTRSVACCAPGSESCAALATRVLATAVVIGEPCDGGHRARLLRVGAATAPEVSSCRADSGLTEWIEERLQSNTRATAVAPLPEPALRWTWLLAGSTLFAATTATLIGLNAGSLESDLRDELAAARDEARPAAVVTDLQLRADDQAKWANVMWGVTGLLAAATLGTMAIELWSRESHAGTDLRLVLSPQLSSDGAAAILGGSF